MAHHQSRAPLPDASLHTQALAKAATERKERREALQSLDCLRDVPNAELERLTELGVLRAFAVGTTILSERKFGEFLYLVLRGTVRVTLHDRDGREVLLGVLDRGDCIGEGPLFGDYFRRVTAVVERPCNLLQVPLAEVRTLLATAPHLFEALRTTYRQRLSHTTLGRVPLFNKLAHIDRAAMLGLLRPSTYERGEAVVTQGTPGQALYLIEAGQAVVERNNLPIAYLDEGDFFGEMSLLDGKPHNATVRAMTPLTVVALPAQDLQMLLERNPALASNLQTVVAERRVAAAHMVGDRDRSRQLTAAVQNGLLRGSNILARVPALCPVGCRICETACADRFGQTRLHLNGTAIGELDVVNACRQCRVGAECSEVCPEDALTWDERGVLVVNDRCTGCGLCVDACPYDAVELPPAKLERSGPLWQLLAQMQQRVRHPTIPLEPVRSAQRASKCDLCHGYGNMACLSACPTGSLRLIPVEELFPL